MQVAHALVGVALLAAAPAFAAGNGTLNVTATVLSKSICKLSAANASVGLPTLDPSSGGAQSTTGSLSFVCHGSDPVATFSISAGNGLHYAGGSRRMLHVSASPEQHLRYTVDLSPATGVVAKNVVQNIVVTLTVAQPDFGDAIAGTYSDTVEIVLTP